MTEEKKTTRRTRKTTTKSSPKPTRSKITWLLTAPDNSKLEIYNLTVFTKLVVGWVPEIAVKTLSQGSSYQGWTAKKITSN